MQSEVISLLKYYAMKVLYTWGEGWEGPRAHLDAVGREIFLPLLAVIPPLIQPLASHFID